MLNKFKILIKLAKEHKQIPVFTTDKRHLGIFLTLVGLLFLALYTVLFEIEVQRFHVKIEHSLFEIFFGFSIFHLVMFMFFFLFSLPQGISFFKAKEPLLLGYRTFFAIISFCAYSFSRVWTNVIDNSMLYSTDAFWIILILLMLGIKIKKLSILGIVLGLFGIIYIYSFDFKTFHSLIGGTFGLISGITLAIITVITTFLVKQDPPLRIGLYQSFFGFLTFFSITIFFGFVQGWSLPNSRDILMMSFSGIFFALTLFCIWEAFYYTESYIIGVLSYFLPVFIIFFGWILNEDPITSRSIIGTSLLTIGSLIVVIDSFLRRSGRKLPH